MTEYKIQWTIKTTLSGTSVQERDLHKRTYISQQIFRPPTSLVIPAQEVLRRYHLRIPLMLTWHHRPCRLHRGSNKTRTHEGERHHYIWPNGKRLFPQHSIIRIPPDMFNPPCLRGWTNQCPIAHSNVIGKEQTLGQSMNTICVWQWLWTVPSLQHALLGSLAILLWIPRHN